MNRVLSSLISFVSMSVLFWVLGSGAGFLQAYYGYFPREDVYVNAAAAAGIGGPIAWIVGIVAFYGLFRQRELTFHMFSSVAAVAVIAGVAAAIGLRFVGSGELPWLSMFVTPAAAAAALFWLRRIPPKQASESPAATAR